MIRLQTVSSPTEPENCQPRFMSQSSQQRVLICQNRTCRKQGSAKVLAAFEQLAMPELIVTGTGCLGQCGNGPMVAVLPAQICYSHVHPDDVQTLIQHHL